MVASSTRTALLVLGPLLVRHLIAALSTHRRERSDDGVHGRAAVPDSPFPIRWDEAPRSANDPSITRALAGIGGIDPNTSTDVDGGISPNHDVQAPGPDVPSAEASVPIGLDFDNDGKDDVLINNGELETPGSQVATSSHRGPPIMRKPRLPTEDGYRVQPTAPWLPSHRFTVPTQEERELPKCDTRAIEVFNREAASDELMNGYWDHGRHFHLMGGPPTNCRYKMYSHLQHLVEAHWVNCYMTYHMTREEAGCWFHEAVWKYEQCNYVCQPNGGKSPHCLLCRAEKRAEKLQCLSKVAGLDDMCGDCVVQAASYSAQTCGPLCLQAFTNFTKGQMCQECHENAKELHRACF